MILKGVKHFGYGSEFSWPSLRRVAANFGMPAVEPVSEVVGTAGSSPARKHVLHVFPSFGIGGVPLRMVRIINHLGKRLRHTVIALDNNFEAAASVNGDLDVTIVPVSGVSRGLLHNLAAGALTLRRLRPDLLMTYNWGAIEWAAACRISRVRRHVHLEAGFGRGEADTQFLRRVLFRRWALGRCALIVVPSCRLQDLASRVWRLPAARIVYIPNGVDTERFSAPECDGVPGFVRRPGEMVIGTVAPLRPEKNVGRLLRADLGDRGLLGLDRDPASPRLRKIARRGNEWRLDLGTSTEPMPQRRAGRLFVCGLKPVELGKTRVKLDAETVTREIVSGR
jgi:glycosyltransferase involved in cell wall biosynthesis